MKFSENWLRHFVDPKVDRDELVRRLTMAGLEVEAVTPLGEALSGVVIAEIVAAEKHPNADKLRVCQVDIGSGARLQIVCGAPNARVGLKAPLATVGAVLPNGTAIKAAALRGVDSQGMLCSAIELGLSDDAAGLMELPPDAPVGQALTEFLALPDATLELKLTPNRPDCLGLRGLASEVATLFGIAKSAPVVDAVVATSDAMRSVVLYAPADCPRYLGRVIEGIDPQARTPLWMSQRLQRSGLRSISAVVDCTNYVLLELGQPMHAFDLAKLDGGIVVRRARGGETLKLLDGRDAALGPEFLVIADASKALAVAGVMGGFDSRVTDATHDVFLESAHFVPASIVGRARKLGLHTDASHRFERGVDPQLPRQAMEHLSELLLQIVGGRAGPITEAQDQALLPRALPVRLRHARVQRLLGLQLPRERIEMILRGLDMSVQADGDGWLVTPPSRRFDIAIEEDLIEEVVRIHGYDQVETRTPSGLIALSAEPEALISPAAVRQTLQARGYNETVGFAFVSAALLQTWGLGAAGITLANPLSAELAVMRTSLLPGLVQAAVHNLARQQTRLRLYEIGRAFERVAGAGEPRETQRLAGLVLGAAAAEQWGASKRAVDFFDLKGDLEQVLALRGPEAAIELRPGGPEFLHPGRAASLWLHGAQVGQIGSLHPRLLKALGVDQDVYVFELDLTVAARRGLPRAMELSRFPMLRRDISLLVPLAVSFAALEHTTRQALGVHLKQLVLFDQFVGKDLPEGTRSLSMGLILQDDYRTLTDQDAVLAVDAAVQALAREHQARLRS